MIRSNTSKSILLDGLELALTPCLRFQVRFRPFSISSSSYHDDKTGSHACFVSGLGVENKSNDDVSVTVASSKVKTNTKGSSIVASSKAKAAAPSKSPVQKPKKRPPLTRLNPSQPILPLNGLFSIGPSSSSASASYAKQHVRQRSAAISQLYSALETTDPDLVFRAYLEIPTQLVGNPMAPLRSGETLTIRTHITAREMRSVLNILIKGTPRLREGLHRLLSIIDDVRKRRNMALGRVQQLQASVPRSRSSASDIILTDAVNEFEEWNQLLDTKVLTALISFTGRCIRSAGPADVNDALKIFSQMQGFGFMGGNDPSHPSPPHSFSEPALFRVSVEGKRLQHHVASHRLVLGRGKSTLPDIVTYNTLLDIICHSVHPFLRNPTDIYSFGSEYHYDNGIKVNRDLSDQTFSAELTIGKARYTTATALKLFETILERMRIVSRLEPDRITFNVMINMYSRLHEWEKVVQTVRIMVKKKLLDTKAINAALWGWSKRVKPGPDTVQDVFQVYTLMRSNLEQRAEAGHQPDESNATLEKILGINSLPNHIIPDEITYTMVIQLHTFQANFTKAFTVFKQMISTRDESQPTQHEQKETFFQPSIAIYNSFFRAFAKHSIPSNLVSFHSPFLPLSSCSTIWQPPPPPPPSKEGEKEEGEQPNLWTISTFIPIFTGFLNLSTTQTSLISYNQLFFLITATRRVSQDHSKWCLAIWKLIVQKVGSNHKSLKNNRLHRVIKFLKSKQ